MLNEYSELFASGYQTVDDVRDEFNEVFGETYSDIDPAFSDFFSQVEISSFSGPDLSSRKDICSNNAFASSMTLDMVKLTHASMHEI